VLPYFTQALKRSGLPGIRLYDARHTYTTWLLEQGVSPKTVQTIRGHGSIAVTPDIDSHVSLALEKQAAVKLHAASTGVQLLELVSNWCHTGCGGNYTITYPRT